MKNIKPTVKKILICLLKSIPVIVELFILALAHKTAAVNKASFVFYLLCLISVGVTVSFLILKTEKLKPLSWAVFAIAPAASFFLLESMIRNPFEIKGKIIFLNLAILYLFSFLVFFASGKTAPAVFSVALYGFVAGLGEHFVLIFRDAPVYPWDLRSLFTTGLSVVDNYEFEMPYSLAASAIALVMLMTLAVRLPARLTFGGFSARRSFKTKESNAERRTSLIVRSVAAFLSLAMLGGTVYYVNLDRSYKDFGMYPYLFTPKVVYSRNGFTVAFLSMLRYVTVSKPDGYSAELLEDIKIRSEFAATQNNAELDLGTITPTGQMPDIIVVMNEAFSDLSVLTEFETTTGEDYMPFLHSLTENTVKGNLHVSVLGGNTANTEFEFLTGASMAFLPTGSIPYQQYIKGETASVASQLKSLGYETISLHPYNTKGWNRNTVYPDLGIDDMIFKINMHGQFALCRSYVTDRSGYKYILNKINRGSDAPKFVFNVTMQNHGSYTDTYDNFDYKDITAKGLEGDVKLSTYLSLIKKSDDAMKYLLTQLEKSDRPTVVCFFGDHQPAATVTSKLLKKYGVTLDEENNINDLTKRYIVPFYIWANYDIEEAEYEAISVNYLSTLLCKTVGLPMTDAQAFLWDLYQEYPVITANVFMDADGRIYPFDAYEEHHRLLEYAALQYNYLFDGDEYDIFSD